MGFIERLIQEDTTKAQRSSAQRKAEEKERLQREAYEQKDRTHRRLLAEKFRQESGIGTAVYNLGAYLATPTIPFETREDHDGYYETITRYKGRGDLGLPDDHLPSMWRWERDRDSVLNTVHWDHTVHYGYGRIKCSYKYIAVESRPDGSIKFHAGWLGGSTSLREAEWRIQGKEQILDRALERAFKNPAVHRYSYTRPFNFGGS